jgi:tetratricopeptide (TPR) repeat protein
MRKSTLAFTLLAASALYACASAPLQETATQQTSVQPAQAKPAQAPNGALKAQLMVHAYEVRSGRFEGAPKAVALMQEATAANPNNADMWVGMSTAHFLAANAALAPGGKLADGLVAIQNAAEASGKALAIDPNNAEALGLHGTAMVILSGFQQKPELRSQGLAELNRGVSLSPNNVSVRLQRAFSNVNMPFTPERNAAAIEDLGFLADKAKGLRSGDYVRVMQGDVYFEIGQPDLARQAYEAASKSPRPGGDEARSRLAALAGPGVAKADIAKLRAATGNNCMMCHGS